MARKKKTQTDKSAAPRGATGDETTASAAAQDTPEAKDARTPDTAGTESAKTATEAETTGTHTEAETTGTQWPEPASGSDPSGAGEQAAEDPEALRTTEHDTVAGASSPDTDGETEATVATGDTAPGPEGEPAADTAPDDTADISGTTPEAPDFPPRDETEEAASGETPEPPEDEPKAAAGGDTASVSADHAPETAPVMRTEQVTVRQGGFWSMLIGGIAAAGIGVAAAPYIYPHLPVGPAPEPAPAPVPSDDRYDALVARLDEQAQRLSDLGARLGDIPAPVDRSDEISGLSTTVTSLTERVANLEVQFSNLEVPAAPEPPDTTATDAALEELRDSLAAQSAEIQELRATLEAEEQAARDSARATLQRAALTRVMTALDTGEEFSPALNDLRESGLSVPDALAEVSETGVPTRSELVEGFPAAARAALSVARAEGSGDGLSVRSFLQAQLGVRSLEPREGDDPDAVLSRAEAALTEGRIADALAEIETLPEDARVEMSGWAAKAAARKDALSAAESLSAELN